MSEPKEKSLLIYRVKFIALIMVLVSPFIGGWLAFYVFDYRPVSQNYGELVQPVRPMSFPELSTEDGRLINSEFWNKWTFVVLANSDCKELCKNNLYYLRQMRVALGRDFDRVQNVLILGQEVDDELSKFLTEYPEMTVVSKAEKSLLNAFDLPGIQPGAEPVLYLLDPAGNLMMTYTAVNEPSSILSDMRRLLRISQIG